VRFLTTNFTVAAFPPLSFPLPFSTFLFFHQEVLNVRWAYDDPNPVALEAAERADADAVVNMLSMRGVALAPGTSSNGSSGVNIGAGTGTGSGAGTGAGGSADAGADALSQPALEHGQVEVAPPSSSSRVVEVSRKH